MGKQIFPGPWPLAKDRPGQEPLQGKRNNIYLCTYSVIKIKI